MPEVVRWNAVQTADREVGFLLESLPPCNYGEDKFLQERLDVQALGGLRSAICLRDRSGHSIRGHPDLAFTSEPMAMASR